MRQSSSNFCRILFPLVAASLLICALCSTPCTVRAHEPVPPSGSAPGVTAQEDNRAPALVLELDSCRSSALATFTETEPEDQGLLVVVVLESLNCTVDIDYSAFPDVVTARVVPVDPMLDAVFAIEAVDHAANARYTRDTLPGFTVRFADGSAPVVFPDVPCGTVYYGSLMMYNDGRFPMTVDGASLAQNTTFSLPLSQFPITVAPGDSAALRIALLPGAPGLHRDTIGITSRCRTVALPVAGTGWTHRQTLIDTLCGGAAVRLTTAPSGARQSAVVPNPTDGRAVLHVDVPVPARLSIRIVNTAGTTVRTIQRDMQPGGHGMEIDVSHIQPGLYYCEITGDGGRSIVPMQIIR